MKAITKLFLGLTTLSLVLVGCNKETEPTPEPTKYTVTFNSNGGSPVSPITVNEGETISKPTNPTKDGYTFVNWFEENTLTKVFNFSTKITKDWTLYAGWEEVTPPEPTKYTVTFNSNGGTPVSPITVNEGETISKPTNPTRDGYTFVNWFEEETLLTPFDFSTKITKNWTLYAGWEEVTPPEPTKYTVNFYNYDNTLLDSVQVEEHGDAVYGGVSPIRPDDDTYTYTFSGWDKSLLDVTENINTTAQYERFFAKTTKVIAIGDAHVCSDETSKQHLVKTLEYVKENKTDVVLFNGDTVDVGIEDNYTIVDGILEDAFGGVNKEDRPTFVFTMGNHEFYPSGTCKHEETDWNREFNKFRTFANKWATYQIKENENIYSQVIKGITYICAFPGIDSTWTNESQQSVYLAATGEFSDSDLEKLENKLDEANALDSTKPIVVMTHWPWGETYGGPNYGVGTEAQIAKMKAVLGKYPQVVNLTSHTHFSNLHDRDIGQSTYTSINVGTHCYGKYVSDCEFDENNEIISYANIKNRRIDGDSQAANYHGQTHFGLQLAFERDELKVDRVNLAKKSLYNHGTFVIPYNITKDNLNEKFSYTSNKRSGPEFTFTGDDSVSVTAIERKNEISVDIAFKDADQYYAAEGYKIVLEDLNGQELYSIKWASLFWADLGQRNTYSMKTTLNGGIANFVAKVYPIDFYGHYGAVKSLNVEVEANIYGEQEAKEEASGDLFFSASIADNTFDSEHTELNTYCLDTVNSSSGLSYKINADTEAEGYPSILIQLNKSYNLTNNAGFTFKAKFVTEGETAKKWMSFFLYDSNGNQITTEIGNDFSGDDGVWLSCSISNSKIVNNLKSGYDLTDIRFVRFNFNFNANKGNNQSIWLDELHFIDVPTLQNNIEMVEMDKGMTTATTSTTYTDVYGNDSTSARKFTFEDADLANVHPSWGRPRVVFSPDNSGLSNIDLCNTTMSFDIKLSSEFFNNDNPERYTFVLIMYATWEQTKLNVYNFLPGGAAVTPETWVHLEQNMDISIYSGFHSLIRMEFQFFGLNDTTKTTAWVVIDNITFTPNA